MRIAWSALDLRGTGRDESEAGRSVIAASLIKLPIMFAVLDGIDDGRFDPGTPLPVLPGQRVGGSGWIATRPDVTSLPVGELVAAMIEHSDNTATNTLIDAVGMPAVARAIERSHLTGTVLRRHMMDAAARARGEENLTTAGDMSTLLRTVAGGDDRLSLAARAYAIGVLLRQRTTGRLDAALPAGYRLAHKTGELDSVRHDVGLVLDADGPRLAVAVLCDGVTDPAEADAAIAARAAALYDRFGIV